jgi:hypothetical protein
MFLQVLEQLHSMMNRRDCDVDDVESWRSRFSNEALCLVNAVTVQVDSRPISFVREADKSGVDEWKS